MQGDIVDHAKKILGYVEKLSEHKVSFNNAIDVNKKAELNKQINLLLDNMHNENHAIFDFLKIKKGDIDKKEIKQIQIPRPQTTDEEKSEAKPLIKKEPEKQKLSEIKELPKVELNSNVFKMLSEKEKKQYIKELDINYIYLKNFIKNYKKKGNIKEIKRIDYTIYRPSSVGEFTNKLFKKTSDNLIKKYPSFFKPMFGNFLTVEMELLSRSYVSMMIFFTIVSIPLGFLFFFLVNLAFKLHVALVITFSILTPIFTFAGFYFYPASLIGPKKRKIKLELPFALVHMGAVAGSGAQPLSIFELIADSEEYPELRKEIKKILNYVNLFGYSLSNSLRNVANTTASPEFKEVLSGMVSTIETGGDLKGYLREKSNDALNLYKLDRKKQIEALSTYSEVYTSILIAAPLLLLITLAIINPVSGNIGGMDVKIIAWVGVAGVLPLVNVVFMFFVNASQRGI